VTSTESISYGAVVGWTSQDLGERVVLHVQSVTKPAPHSDEDVRSSYYMLDKNQAVQLGNYLFELAGLNAPRKRRRSWLGRILG
jgi:hypothetical protein